MKELVIVKGNENNKEIYLFENKELVERYIERERKTIAGNIYIGKVQNILTGLRSAFINIGEGKNAFIHERDLPQNINAENDADIIPINKVLKSGMPLMVEVKRDSSNYKGPRVSTKITLSSRFIVFMPNTNFITISQKIENEEEKERLKDIVSKYIPENTGAIIRTVAENVTEKDLEEDIKRLLDKWNTIKNTEVSEYPMMVYEKGGILRKTIIDLIDSGLDNIICETEELKEIIDDILIEINAKAKIEIDKDASLRFELHKRTKELEDRKIWLKSGGFITIDKTEALTAIDVNTGKYIGEDNLEDTINLVNQEAIVEIAKQLRLRDIGGIVIIDFIDMKEEESKNRIIEILKKEIKKDRSKVQIEEFTKLNLLELTRKNINI